MSILTEFFVSTDDLAPGYDADKWPQADVFFAGGLLPLTIELLWAILQGREWDNAMGDEFVQVGGDGEETWIVRFPSSLTCLLAESSASKLDAARIQWANEEDLSVDPKELVDVMAALHKLAQNAMATGRSVYLWGSL